MSRHFLSIKILIILFWPIVLSSYLLAKNVTIAGRVSNPEGNPLKKVNVTIRNLKDHRRIDASLGMLHPGNDSAF